jgi:hypothetical protein
MKGYVMRLRTINLLILLFILLSMTGCADVRQTLRDARIPTIGPVQGEVGRPGRASLTLSSNTNCAEIGEVITFDLRIANEATYPITLTGNLLFDIVLEPASWPLAGPIPARRWSESNQYPNTVNQVLAPGTAQTYQWQWAAEAVYGQAGVKGIVASVSTAVLRPGDTNLQASKVEIGVGVHSMPGGESAHAGIECAAMQR